MRRTPALVLSGAALAALIGCGPKRPLPGVPTADRGPSPFAVALAWPDAGPGRRAVTLNASTGAETLHVESENVLTLDDVTAVRFRTDFDPEGVVEFDLTPEGRERLARATAGHVGGRMAILLRGFVHSAPRVQAPVTEGTFLLSGGGTPVAEWEELAAKVSGALKR